MLPLSTKHQTVVITDTYLFPCPKINRLEVLKGVSVIEIEMLENLVAVGSGLQTCSGVGLSLIRSGWIALEVPRRLALPCVFLVHMVEKLICSTAPQRVFTLQVFHGFPKSPRKCSGTSKKKSMSQDSISQNQLMGHLH